MAHRSGHPWSQDECVIALTLYCQLPFGKMHSKNSDIQQLATRLGRTPASIALKLVNFASLDPEHKKRGIAGMGHVSALDRQVWEEFYGKWEALAYIGNETLDAVSEEPTQTDAEAMVRTRRGQSFFRRSVLAAYAHKCCVTGIASSELVRASHIVPWAIDASSRLDPSNGLALNSLHDAAFDRGLMTLDEKHCVLFSDQLRVNNSELVYEYFFAKFAGRNISVPERFVPKEEYLAYHREHVFVN